MSDLDKGQSFRLACNSLFSSFETFSMKVITVSTGCRAHKLRCTQDKIANTSGACQRCQKAKVRCVFSVRSRAKSSKSTASVSKEVGQSHSKIRSQGVTASIDASFYIRDNQQPSTLDYDSLQCQTLSADCLGSKWLHDRSLTVSLNLDKKESEGFMNEDTTMNGFTVGTELNSVPSMEKNPSSILMGLSETDLFWDLNTPASVLETAQVFTPPSIDLHGSNEVSLEPLGNANDDGTHKLSTLVVDFHQLSMKLNQGPWPKNNLQPDHAMGGYPIGDILHLSQELISVLSSVCMNAGQDLLEVTLALLILNCHVSLIRTYSIVFSHLNQYLLTASSLLSPGSRFRSFPGQLLEELQPWNEACNRTYAAFRMLFGSLSRVEMILDLPSQFRCVRTDRRAAKLDLAMTTPRSDISSSDESCSDDRSGTASESDHEATQYDRLLDDKLLKAVLRREALIGMKEDEGGIALLRKRIKTVKRTLRQKMAL